MNNLIRFFVIGVLLCSTQSMAQTSVMMNDLVTTGEGSANPSYGTQIKNILIFQAAGWSGLPALQDSQQNDPSWPLAQANLLGGRVGYLSKSKLGYLSQMSRIKELSGTTAIAQLIMPDLEANASGYGTCFNGQWISATACANGGVWKKPKSLFDDVRWAAWMKGIKVAPLFSVNVYDESGNTDRANIAVERLKSLVNWYTNTYTDAVTLRTTQGKIVILTEGLPENTNLGNDSGAQKKLLDYMNSRKDILWIDNLAVASPTAAGGNVYRSAATFDITGSIQDHLKATWGNRYLWHFQTRFGTRRQQMYDPLHKIPLAVREKWLNLNPYNATAYPVIISQWNEYAEFLTFEPDEWEGYAEYNYLRWMLSLQK